MLIRKPLKFEGITLVELIVYVAITSIVLLFVLRFMWNVSGVSIRVDVSTELIQNSRFILDKISYDLHVAENVVIGSSTFNTHPGALMLDMPAGAQNIFYDTYEKDILVGRQTIKIRKLRRRAGEQQAVDVTGDKVNVANFVLKNRTRAQESSNIKIEFTLAFVNPGQDPQRNRELNVETAVSLRQ